MLTPERKAELRRMWDTDPTFVPRTGSESSYMVSVLVGRNPDMRGRVLRIREDARCVFSSPVPLSWVAM
jgi:hypothetical protein